VGGNEIWCRCGGGRVVVFLRESFSQGASSSTVTGAKKREISYNIYLYIYIIHAVFAFVLFFVGSLIALM